MDELFDNLLTINLSMLDIFKFMYSTKKPYINTKKITKVYL